MRISTKAKVLSGTLGLALLVSAVPVGAQEQSMEQTLSQLREKIAELQEQINELRSQTRERDAGTGTSSRERVQTRETDAGTGTSSEERGRNRSDDSFLPDQASDRAHQVMDCIRINRMVRRGDRGPQVKQMQEWLKSEGHFDYPEATGYYGKDTEEAVKRFQAAQGIVSQGSPRSTGYGQVGPKTRAVMEKVTCLREGTEDDGEDENEQDEEGEEGEEGGEEKENEEEENNNEE